MPRRLVLVHKQAPGDIVCLTALVRDIQLQYPGEFELDFDTTATGLWKHNPHLTTLWNHDPRKPQITAPGTQFLRLCYASGLREQNSETIHFAAYFHRAFERQTGVKVIPRYPHGDLHLSAEERDQSPIASRYWVVLSGGKNDFPIKVWDPQRMQQVVDRLRQLGLGVVQIGSSEPGHWHPPLSGVLNLVGRTSIRDWLRLIYHADGVVCGVTGSMHIAAALQRPCVVIAGGREAWWWEAYVNENRGFGPLASGRLKVPHRYLHTIGQLDCCSEHGCWKDRVVPVHPGQTSLCYRPVRLPHADVAECLLRITPEHVVTAVLSYYYDGTLPPLPGMGT